MRFLLRRIQSLDPQHKANGTALAVVVSTLAFLNLECSPRPAGGDTFRVTVQKTPDVILTAQAPVETDDASLSPEQLSERTLVRKVEMLKKGVKFLESTPDYTAQFMKRELVNGELLEEQTMAMKLRHEPFSIYLKWMDFEVGREVMYVDGVNDGKMLVHSGGWKARLPAILMAPDCTLAMKEARYPVTRAGLLSLATTIIDYNSQDLVARNYSRCVQLDDQMVGDRSCATFILEYFDRDSSKEYRKSVTLIDKEWCVPLYIKNFGWPGEDFNQEDADLDESTLIEHYTYSDVKFRSSLSALDFDNTNEDYNFRR